MNKKMLKKHKAASLATVMIIMVVVSSLLAVMYVLFSNNIFGIKEDMESKQLYYFSRSGIEIAESALSSTDKNGVRIMYDKLRFPNPTYTALTPPPQRSEPLIDYISNKQIPDIPDDVNIFILIDYISPNEKYPPTSSTGAPSHFNLSADLKDVERFYKKDKEGMFLIISKAEKISGTSVVDSYILVEYIDPEGVNSSFE